MFRGFSSRWSGLKVNDNVFWARDLFLDLRYVVGGDGDQPDGVFLALGINFSLVNFKTPGLATP